MISSDATQAASTLTEKQISELGGGTNGLTWFQWQDLGPDKRPSLAGETPSRTAELICQLPATAESCL